MYLVGATIPKTSLLTEWKGKKGKFVRTFGINTKRNKNKWRVSWESIKKYIHTAIDFPGIEYEKCTSEGCDLDHVEADSFSEVIEKQKPFERTKIIDYILDEENESADLIDEVFDDDFWEKLQTGEIKYVSPMIWPYTGGFEILGHDDVTGQPIIDAFAWKFVHKAYLTKSPAFGDDVAQVKSMCEGENCDVQLLSASALRAKKEMCGNCKFFTKDNLCELVKGKIGYDDICDLHESGEVKPKGTEINPRYDKDQVSYEYRDLLKAETTTSNQQNISHLQEIPLLYKHKGSLHFVSASNCVQEIIKKKKADGIKIDDQALAIAYSECGESTSSAKAKSSFKTCTCDSNHNTMPNEQEYKDMQAKLKAAEDDKKDLEVKMKGMEDDHDKVAKYSKAKAKFSALFKGNTEDQRKELIAKMKGMEDEEHMKAMEEVHNELKAKEDGQGNDTEISKLKASITKLQEQNLPSMIDGLIALKASSGVDQKVLREYHTSLLAKTFVDVETLYSNDEIIIKGLPAKATEEKYDFTTDELNSLKGKTSSEIILEAQK